MQERTDASSDATLRVARRTVKQKREARKLVGEVEVDGSPKINGLCQGATVYGLFGGKREISGPVAPLMVENFARPRDWRHPAFRWRCLAPIEKAHGQ
jgi:hypothetical protein